MHNFLIGKFKVINFKTGAQLNTDYTIPLWVLFLQYRAAVVSGQVIMNGAMRDGINNNAISTASSENYRVLNSQALNAVALVIALILCSLAVVILCVYLHIAILWYYIVGAVIAAFIVYLVATGGWEKVSEMWNRTKYNKKTE